MTTDDRSSLGEERSRRPAPRPRIAIIGAGVAGLTAGSRLRSYADVVVVDKGRGVGGRLASRRLGDATFDHGAQFLTARTPAFIATTQELLDDGIIRGWFDGRPDSDGVRGHDGHTRYCGVISMNAIAKRLATGLDVRTSTHVDALERDGDRWTMRLADGASIDADGVIATAPVPQFLAMLDRGAVEVMASDAAVLESVEYEPCLALMVALDGPSGIPEPGAIRFVDGPIDWIADNQIKGISRTPAVTIHASAELSRRRWDDELEAISSDLLDVADLRSAPLPDGVSIKRWRYARPTSTSPRPCLPLEGLPPIVCAGDAFGGPRVEGAAISGAAAAVELLHRLGVNISD